MFEEALAADNMCLAAAQGTSATVAIHICRGNNESKWYAEGGYDSIAEKLFGTLNVDRFLLEYDTDRAGTFEPLRFVPRGKIVVLEVWPESHWPGFALRQADVIQSYTAIGECMQYVLKNPLHTLANRRIRLDYASLG